MQNQDLLQYWSEAKRIFKRRAERGNPEYPTGLSFLDEATDGIEKGEVWVIAGKTGGGKTSLALQLAQSFADNPEHSILFLSLEMKGWELTTRLFCEMNGITYASLKKGIYPDNFKKIDQNFQNYLTGIDFEIVEEGYTFDQVTKILTNGYKYKKPDVMFIDFIQQIEWHKFGNERMALTEYVRKLKELAKTQNIAVVIVSQLRRLPSGVNYDRAPDIIDLKGCIHGESIVNGKKIKEIYDQNDLNPVKSLNLETNKCEYINPSRVVNTGMLECYRIKTKAGKEIIMSKDTKLYNGKWVKVKYVKVGDKIVVNKQISL